MEWTTRRKVLAAGLALLSLAVVFILSGAIAESENRGLWTLAALGVFGSVFLLIKWPETVLYVIAGIYPFQSFVFSHSSLKQYGQMVTFWPVDVFAPLVAAVTAVVFFSRKGETPRLLYSYNATLALFAMLASLSLLWTFNFLVSYYTLLKFYVCLALFYAPVVLVRKVEHLKRIIVIVFVVGLIIAVGGIVSTKIGANWKSDYRIFSYQLPGGYETAFLFQAPMGGKRASGFAVPNFLCYFLACSSVCGVYLLGRKNNPLTSVGVFALLVVLLLGMIYTLSKGGLLAAMGGLAAYIIASRSSREHWVRNVTLFFILVALVFVVFSLVKLKGGVGRLSSGLSSSKISSSTGARLYIWEHGLDALMETWGLGIGIGCLIPLTPWNLWGHNAYFGVLFELGILGFLLYCFVYYIFFYQTYKSRILVDEGAVASEEFAVFLAVLVTWWLHSLIEFDYYLLRVPWFYLGLGVAAIQLKLRAEGSAGLGQRGPSVVTPGGSSVFGAGDLAKGSW